jgi:YVTN family beta-propeller protein
VASIPVGKRPRGIHASPDGKFVYVALSGTPPSPPPKLDAQGNPIFQKGKGDDDDDDKNSDHAADGIGVIDVQRLAFVKKLAAGSDPEQFAVSADGKKIYIANEDVATASVINVADGKVEQIVRVGKEPEGVGLTPDGRFVYVTCETSGEVFVIAADTYKSVAHFVVGGRPRSIAFLPDGLRAFIPSESAGQIHLIDATKHEKLKTLQLPPGHRPMGTAVSRDGRTLYAGMGRAGVVCAIDTSTLEVVSTIKVGPRPWGVAVSPDGKFLYSANGPSNDVSVIDLTAGREIGRIKAGQSPWGVAIVPAAMGR